MAAREKENALVNKERAHLAKINEKLETLELPSNVEVDNVKPVTASRLNRTRSLKIPEQRNRYGRSSTKD